MKKKRVVPYKTIDGKTFLGRNERKIEKVVEKITSYKTTDGTIFSGKNAGVDAKTAAEAHQRTLDFKCALVEFDPFMRNLFGIKAKYNPEAEESDEEVDFCNRIMNDVDIYAEDGDFRREISRLILDLFAFIGPDKWLKIHEFFQEPK